MDACSKKGPGSDFNDVRSMGRSPVTRVFPLTLRRSYCALLVLSATHWLPGCHSASDGGCVANPVSGAPCSSELPACDPGAGACHQGWTCSREHQWVGIGSDCVIEPAVMCAAAVPDAACNPGLPACPQPVVPCAPVVTWACGTDSNTWAESVEESQCVVEDGGKPDTSSPRDGSIE